MNISSVSILRSSALASVLALSAALAPAARAVEAKDLKVGVVDVQKVFKEYYKTVQSQADMKKESDKVKAEADERGKRIQELQAQLKKMGAQLEDPALSESKKQEIYQQIRLQEQGGQGQERALRDYVESSKKALDEKMLTSMKALLDEIQALVTTDAKTGNFDYVFDKSGMTTSQVPFLLYSKEAVDMTPDLIAKLNQDAPKTPAATGAPAATPATGTKPATGAKPAGK